MSHFKVVVLNKLLLFAKFKSVSLKNYQPPPDVRTNNITILRFTCLCPSTIHWHYIALVSIHTGTMVAILMRTLDILSHQPEISRN